MAAHPLHRVLSFTIVAPHTLQMTFDDGLVRTIDFGPVLEGELFGPLRDLALFNRVAIDPEAHTLVWPNGADFDPATLHDWPVPSERTRVEGPDAEPELIRRARRWAQSSRSGRTTSR